MNECKPLLLGAAVSVEATADAPGSRVFFLAYDVSVALQAGGAASALTAVRALAAVAPPPPPPVAATGCYPPAGAYTRPLFGST